jgi:hypothetical protein
MLCTKNPISQTNLDISYIWFQLIDKELHK